MSAGSICHENSDATHPPSRLSTSADGQYHRIGPRAIALRIPFATLVANGRRQLYLSWRRCRAAAMREPLRHAHRKRLTSGNAFNRSFEPGGMHDLPPVIDRPNSKEKPMTSFPAPRPRGKLPARYAAIVMPLVLSVLMTFVVSAISTLKSLGPTPAFVTTWPAAWAISWLVAFPTLLAVLPLVRRIVALAVAPPPPK
jgi:hypothetical protein